MKQLKKTILQARKVLKDHPEDGNLAVFMVRDFQFLKDTELGDLVWAMYQERYTGKGEAVWLLDRIDEEIKRYEQKQNSSD